MTELPTAHISLDGSNGEIQINGSYLFGVTGFTLRGSVGRPPMLTVTLAIDEVEVDSGETTAVIPKATRDTLVALGWTPPKAT